MLDADFSFDGTSGFVGGCDNKVYRWDFNTGKFDPLGSHNAPVKNVFWVPDLNSVVTASWDGSIRIWDIRSPNPTVINIGEKIACMDVKGSLIVAGMDPTSQKVYCFDTRRGTSPMYTFAGETQYNGAPLKSQYRSVAIMNDGNGFSIGSVEGRVAVRVFDKLNDDKVSYTFKCHRIKESATARLEQSLVFSVNSLSFHPTNHTVISTAGSDGVYYFWDLKSKSKLKESAPSQFGNNPSDRVPITASSFNNTGNMFAYALGYAWDYGVNGYNAQSYPNSILIKNVEPNDLAPKRN